MKVLFRKFKQGGDIIALFPEQTNRNDYTIASYMHIGQHSNADYDSVISQTIPAKEGEYVNLLTELKNIGYEDLQIMRKYRPKYN